MAAGVSDPFGGSASDDDTVDEDNTCVGCPLCRIEDVSVETAASTGVTTNNRLRRIMGIELMNFGMVPDSLIYHNISRQYNKNIYKCLVRAGFECVKWTPAIVRKHFEQHVQLVPRRAIGRDIRRLEAASRIVDREITNSVDVNNEAIESRNAAIGELDENGEPIAVPPIQVEVVDKRILDKLINLTKAKFALLRDYRNYQKEDMVSTGIDTLWKSVTLGETSVTDAKKLLEAAATLRSAAGPGDLPKASELFE